MNGFLTKIGRSGDLDEWLTGSLCHSLGIRQGLLFQNLRTRYQSRLWIALFNHHARGGRSTRDEFLACDERGRIGAQVPPPASRGRGGARGPGPETLAPAADDERLDDAAGRLPAAGPPQAGRR